MAILYRAIWSDSDADLVHRARQSFLHWVDEKSNGRLSPTAPTTETTAGPMRLRFEFQQCDDLAAPIRAALQASLIETRNDGSRWTTTVRGWEGPCTALEPGSTGGWIWVDVDAVAVTHDALDKVVVGAPRFARRLLEEGTKPNRFDVPLKPTVFAFSGDEGAEELAAFVTNVDRDVPMAIFAPPPADWQSETWTWANSIEDWLEQVTRNAARMAAGLAMICRLDPAAARSFTTIVGEDYEVRDGAFRIYLPGVDPALDEGRKHRYTLPTRFMRSKESAGKLIIRAISRSVGARRAPASFERADQFLESSRNQEPTELKELLRLADEELAQQRASLAALDRQYIETADELGALSKENSRLRASLNQAIKKLADAGLTRWDDETASERWRGQIPDNAESPSHAALLAQEHLHPRLVIPDEACIDLDDLDNAATARAWGETSWRAFRALHAYAEALKSESDPGSFWTSCQNSQHPYAWPANAKKLALAESETVNNSERLRSKRMFPVSEAVDASGRIFMQCHMKIAEGGSSLAPRIYFFVSHETATVHVGYFGPHRNVPNTQT